MRITPEIESLIDRALAEDLSIGDPTSQALIPTGLTAQADIVARVEGTLAGVDVALAVFGRVDLDLDLLRVIEDGSTLKPGDVAASVKGDASSILQAERTALNFVQKLSGIATETARYVRAVAGYKAYVVDTRKTTPGLRVLEKYAVRMGGGRNHRQNLGDGILIKDNHIQALRSQGLSLGEIVCRARARAGHTIRVEVEVEDLIQMREALGAGAEIILLDNMGLEDMSRAVELVSGGAVTEASGGISLDTVEDVAATGVDLISVGALTHSSRALDMSLELRG